MHKLKFALPFLLMTTSFFAAGQTTVQQWDFAEISLKGPVGSNPFIDVSLSATFTQGDTAATVDGFYDGEGIYKIRFMPGRAGRWSYATTSNNKTLNGKKGSFECVPPSPGNRGPVGVQNKFHFAYADATPYLPVGTTCYAWIHQEKALQEQTLQTLKESPFNKLRMTIFPKWYEYNRREPLLYPYEKGNDGKWDFTRFNPAFFRAIENRLMQLRELGIEADLILFHPYDEGHWGFDRMSREANLHYLRYVLSRFAAFRNVWWSMANEYDLDRNKTMEDWEAFFQQLQEKDPYRHLTSIHNGDIDKFYDHSKPYITHVSVQHPDMKNATAWKAWGKPVVNDECEYEGNVWLPWGNISGRELVNRAWLGYTYGVYVGHGETFDDGSDILWWSHGGKLKGESTQRLAFLRKFMEETSPRGLDSFDPKSWLWTRFAAGRGDGVFVYYFAEHQPQKWIFYQGDEGKEYSADVVDTWNMQTTPLPGKFKKGSTIPLPGKPHLALRLKEAR